MSPSHKLRLLGKKPCRPACHCLPLGYSSSRAAVKSIEGERRRHHRCDSMRRESAITPIKSIHDAGRPVCPVEDSEVISHSAHLVKASRHAHAPAIGMMSYRTQNVLSRRSSVLEEESGGMSLFFTPSIFRGERDRHRGNRHKRNIAGNFAGHILPKHFGRGGPISHRRRLAARKSAVSRCVMKRLIAHAIHYMRQRHQPSCSASLPLRAAEYHGVMRPSANGNRLAHHRHVLHSIIIKENKVMLK